MSKDKYGLELGVPRWLNQLGSIKIGTLANSKAETFDSEGVFHSPTFANAAP